ncbi:DUF4961 domain-containing protein [Niabella ginsengisoli]|uniref:DUF4961 domain-containing protein n=1 Tax=Niabella ginsengisoli TaxID=522298 RepID=A0ABS9SDP1_9BACT|nr:DUF4961 domain-containing protein [Niabella ginsengisoli]MCH5596477.1 DUF4961 domain-containing protein [Niabella ginsengisoli]
MRVKFFKRRNFWKFFSVVVLLALIVACSTDIVSIDQPASINANETLTSIMNCKIDVGGTNPNKTLVIGFLVPKSWQASKNTSVFYTCTALSANNEKMSLMPASERETTSQLPWADALMQDKRYALMGNLINDLEWVVFRSTKTYDVNQSITFEVKVVTKVGEQNMLVNLAYFVGNTSNGLEAPGNDKYHDGKYARLTVENGTGDLIDFVNPQIAMMELAKSTDNDIQTIFYDGDLLPTPLSDESGSFYVRRDTQVMAKQLSCVRQMRRASLNLHPALKSIDLIFGHGLFRFNRKSDTYQNGIFLNECDRHDKGWIRRKLVSFRSV